MQKADGKGKEKDGHRVRESVPKDIFTGRERHIMKQKKTSLGCS